MKYTGNKGDIGISKVQGIVDLKTDLRGYRLKGAEPLKPVDPLFSEGISIPSHQESASFQDFNGNYPRDEVFEPETYRYVKDSSKVPSWIKSSKSNPSLDKAAVHSQFQRNTDRVQVMSDWAGDEPQKAYLSDNSPHYEFSTRFEREAHTSVKVRKTGTGVPTVSPFSVETSLPRDEMAILFYQKYLIPHGYPGGRENKSLEYDKAYEEGLGLIPFCITTITPDHRTYLNFQANLESYSDNYTGDWDSVRYVGRAENFYGYTGFTRTIDLSFKVAIFRKEDCEEMYHRLNRLVGATAPSYDETKLFMRGTLSSLTIGDLLKHKAGIIQSVKITWQQDYPWEVRESERSNIPAGDFMVPHVLDVSLQFTPIEEKTVTEDNGDYFVFRSDAPSTPKSELPAKPDPDPGPESRQSIILNRIEREPAMARVDHTAVNTIGNVEGGGGGTGASVRRPFLERVASNVSQSAIISNKEEKIRRQQAIKNSKNSRAGDVDISSFTIKNL